MRHNPGKRPACLGEAVPVAHRVAYVGKNLPSNNKGAAGADRANAAVLETARTRFMQ